MEKFLWVYVPHNSKDKALEMGRILLDEKLIACVNIIDNMTSMYKWEGKIVEENEIILIIKTKEKLFEELQKRIENLHPYDCPCIIGLNIEKGNKPYMDWLFNQTKA